MTRGFEDADGRALDEAGGASGAAGAVKSPGVGPLGASDVDGRLLSEKAACATKPKAPATSRAATQLAAAVALPRRTIVRRRYHGPATRPTEH